MLEITVFDETIVTDSLGEAISFVEKVLQKVIQGEDDVVFTITVKHPKTNSPPVLGINVSDNTKVGDRLV